jgi:hypothetical protein
MTERNDHDLGDRFHALRREDAATAPPFRATLAAARARAAARPGRRGLWLRAAAVAVTVVVVTGVAVALRFSRPHRRMTIDLATVRWEAPTDFLLRVPGDDLLRTVPELGGGIPLGVDFTTDTSHRRTP